MLAGPAFKAGLLSGYKFAKFLLLVYYLVKRQFIHIEDYMEPLPEQICPACKFKNESNATICANCKTPLGNFIKGQITTKHLAENRVPLNRTEIDVLIKSSLPEKGFTLYLVHNDELILLDEEQVELILGRKTTDTIGDLINIGAYDEFVSRRHAKVIKGEYGYSIMDLGSSNGTWLESQRLVPHRLYPFRSGTQFWFGHTQVLIHYAE